MSYKFSDLTYSAALSAELNMPRSGKELESVTQPHSKAEHAADRRLDLLGKYS